ncbi:MAG: RluA family pseudouridine synthase [Desulfamplus sp.]|nr:RluA family pseudouridine synthase [Desulfamplus sp.]
MEIKFLTTSEFEGCRLDYVVAIKADGYSRSLISQHIKNGDVTVSGKTRKPSYKVHIGEVVSGTLNEHQNRFLVIADDNIKPKFDILHEDSQILVINKNYGVVVHPAPGNSSGTLVNALICYCPQIQYVGEDISRPGIVHRLDKDTSGVMVIAKDNQSFHFLKKEFMQRRVEKRYIALVSGSIQEDSGRIILPIGRHPVKRKMMSTVADNSRYAETLWLVKQRYKDTTLVEAELKTGRTHQVRVHFKAIGHPLVGDNVYGFKKGGNRLQGRKRQMLHAWQLSFRHPWSGKRVDFSAPLPDDMAEFSNFV